VQQLTPNAWAHFFLVDLLASAASNASEKSTAEPVTDLQALEKSIQTITSMLDRVLAYVRSVLAGEVKGDPAVGRYLMDTFGASTGDLEKGGFNASLQVGHKHSSLINPDRNFVLGYPDGIVSRQPCPISSRGIGPISSCNRIIN
jgi:Maintenance of mitochondrial structure and function